MTVAELFADLAPAPAVSHFSVSGLALDSRVTKPGNVFFALSGQHVDGARFVTEALKRGAVAVVSESVVEDPRAVCVPNARQLLAQLSARFYGNPDRKLRLVGITGTNGKTTTALLVAAMLEAAGEDAGIIGTLGARVAGAWKAAGEGASFTTPEAPELCRLLAEMVDAGQRACAMEVSSHALAQERVAGLSFAAAGFTQLTRDHLDFHGDLESYFLAKRRLFLERLAPQGVAVVNGDDAFGQRLFEDLSARAARVLRFSRRPGLELEITDEQTSLTGTTFNLGAVGANVDIKSQLIGTHNVENLALAGGLGLALGLSPQAIERGLASVSAVPGRLERVAVAGAVLAFVDYAHTDDALRRVLRGLRELGADGSPGHRLWVVFGCGGDRDPGKRPLMGQAAALGADVVVATSDNPRSEAPEAILAQVVPGLRAAGKAPISGEAARGGASGFLVEPDRRAAITLAASLAAPGDVLLVAGKGHETTQTVGREKLPFDDRLELRAALERRLAT